MQCAMTKRMKICSSAHNVSLSFTTDVPTYHLANLFVLRYKDIENTIVRDVLTFQKTCLINAEKEINMMI